MCFLAFEIICPKREPGKGKPGKKIPESELCGNGTLQLELDTVIVVPGDVLSLLTKHDSSLQHESFLFSRNSS